MNTKIESMSCILLESNISIDVLKIHLKKLEIRVRPVRWSIKIKPYKFYKKRYEEFYL